MALVTLLLTVLILLIYIYTFGKISIIYYSQTKTLIQTLMLSIIIITISY